MMKWLGEFLYNSCDMAACFARGVADLLRGRS